MTEPSSTKDYPLAPSLAFLSRLWRLNHAMERVSLSMERTLGVTAPQRLVLRCVGKYPGITAGKLATLLHLDRSTVSVALRRMEAAGLVARRRDPRDARRATLTLTPRGEQLNRDEPLSVEGAVTALLAAASPEDLAATARTLDALAAHLDAVVAPPEAP